MFADSENWVIVFSIAVAVIASFATLNLTARAAAHNTASRLRYWVTGGAISVATAVWAMHFVGLLAFDLPVQLSYNIPIPLLSLFIAILVCGFALYTHAAELSQANRMLQSEMDERKKAEERLTHLAQFDSLTSLPNRNLFADRLGHALARAKRHQQSLAVLLLDLDLFKEINDTLGHSMGDKLLQAFALRLQELLREVDMVARLSGDEFTIILEDVSQSEEAVAVAKRISGALANPFCIDGREIFVTASIGITLYPQGGTDHEKLLQTADVALYHAKEDGRNGFAVYSADMSKDTAKRLDMENLLRRALERHEFVLHYQPKVNVKTGRISGVEALLRWDSPELGLVSPAEFIPLIERNGLIVPIGEWVLRRACAESKAWQQHGHTPLLTAVNLSPRQFRQKDLVENVAEILRDTGLDPRFLELEITETMMMVDADRAVYTLRALHELGVQLSVDDFGTGYSSLGYLKRFPVQKLKVDRSFIRDVCDPSGDSAMITAAVIALAKSLNLGVVAEGVESRDQLQYLAKLGCDEYQGYYFSKPLPANEFARLLERKTRPLVVEMYTRSPAAPLHA